MIKQIPIVMNMPGGLKFTKEGKWFNDDVEVTHPGVARYLSRHIRYSEEHSSFVVQVGEKCVLAEVEDTLHVVRSVLTDVAPWRIVLETDEEIEFEPSTLAISKENVLYCRREPEGLWLRLLRSAHQHLQPFIEEGPSGAPVLVIGGSHYRISEKLD